MPMHELSATCGEKPWTVASSGATHSSSLGYPQTEREMLQYTNEAGTVPLRAPTLIE
jgi:hypothetical protein